MLAALFVLVISSSLPATVNQNVSDLSGFYELGVESGIIDCFNNYIELEKVVEEHQRISPALVILQDKKIAEKKLSLEEERKLFSGSLIINQIEKKVIENTYIHNLCLLKKEKE